MTVYFIGAGPGDPEMLTFKAARILASCPVCIWAGSLVNPALLEHCPADCVIHDSAGLDLETMLSLMQQAHEAGRDCARLHTGDPSLYGAIAEQMEGLDERGIPYAVVPGVSSFQAAAAACKLELTAPEVSQAVICCRTPGRTPVPPGQDPVSYASSGATLCCFLSVASIAQLAADLAEHYGAECPVHVVYRASWPDEQIVSGALADIAEKVSAAGIRRQAMILVGHALERPLKKASLLYARHFTHGYREGQA